MQIQGQFAIVTGAGSGLGAGTVRMLAGQKARVLALDQDAEALGRLSASLQASSDSILARVADVADAAQVEAIFAEAVGLFGAPRILVNCAGMLGVGRLLKGDGTPRPLAAFRRVIEVNLIGTFNLIRLFCAAVHDQAALEGGERGVVVNTASVASYEALSAQTAYAASKGGVAGMTLPLARELARYGIRAMAIAPGSFDTGMLAVVPDHTRKLLLEDVPFPARAGRPDEFAALVKTIIENQMLNGEVIRLDGAVRMREPQPMAH